MDVILTMVLEEHRKIDGDATITQDTRLYGLITGSVTVEAGAKLVVHGMVGGDLIVSDGSLVQVYGTVFGDIINRGDLKVIGKVRGQIRREGGSTRIDPNAVIDGGVV
jgi:hypothetical protein